MSKNDPFLDAALNEVIAGPDNVAPGLAFAVEQSIAANDPARCYDPQLIRCAAMGTIAACELAMNKLKAKYKSEFSKPAWRKLVKAAFADLRTASPSELIRSETGVPKSCLANAIIGLRQSAVQLAYDSFASRVVVEDASPWGISGRWADYDDLGAANHLQHSGIDVGPPVVHEAALYLAHEKAFHPVRDWLISLKWDGTPRLDTWMIEHLGTEDNVYMRAICSKWTISALARIMRPGCKADHMIVLEGPQGKRKSMALRALVNGHTAGDSGVQWFRDSMPDIDKDDIGLYMQGVWVIEIAELEAIRGKQWTRVKAFISSQSDTFRRKFGRNMGEYPRQCIFAASTNEEHWNGDTTGGRRFWPITVGHVNVDAILRDREQLWAEARFRYDEGETWWLDESTEELAIAEQQQRTPDDAWIELVEGKTALLSETSIAEVLEKIGERRDQGSMNRCARVLAVLGWTRYRQRQGDSLIWKYKRKD